MGQEKKTYTAPDGSVYRIEADGNITKIKDAPKKPGTSQLDGTPSKYQISPDGKIYRIEPDGSVTYLGNAEDRDRPSYAFQGTAHTSFGHVNYDNNDYDSSDYDDQDNRSDGFSLFKTVGITISVAVVVGILLSIVYFDRHNSDYYDGNYYNDEYAVAEDSTVYHEYVDTVKGYESAAAVTSSYTETQGCYNEYEYSADTSSADTVYYPDTVYW